MLTETAIVTDSLACLTAELLDEYGIYIVPINLLVGEKTYRDGIDITPSQAYELFLKDPQSFQTSPSSPGDYLELFKKLGSWVQNILCITVSSKLSTAFNVASLAAGMAEMEIPGIKINVLDSGNVTAAQAFVVLAAAREIHSTGDVDKAIDQVHRVSQKVHFLAFLNTTRHLYRTGRIPKIAAYLSSGFRVKPILTGSGGEIALKSLAATHDKGIAYLLDIMRKETGTRPVHVSVMHAYDPSEARRLKEKISREFDCVELWVTEMSPVMGYATGTGTIGLAFYADD